MRKFRNAALAGATAVALTFGATSVANATLSSEIGSQTEANQDVTGTDVFGSSALPSDQLPEWAAIARGLTYAGVAAGIFTLVVAPAYNFLAYNNILPLPKF